MKKINLMPLSICLLITLALSACKEEEKATAKEAPVAVKAEKTPDEFNPPVANNISSLRPKTALNKERMPTPLAIEKNTDLRSTRAYPMQAPTIPHKIEGYQIDLKVNKCMSCHSRQQAESSGAIMVSVTHYMNRDAQFLAEISPRRYFCTQCHVVQKNVKPLVENIFIDMHTLSATEQDQH